MKFCLLTENDGGQVTFGGNSKGKIIGSEKVGKSLSSFIDDVMLVEGLVEFVEPEPQKTQNVRYAEQSLFDLQGLGVGVCRDLASEFGQGNGRPFEA